MFLWINVGLAKGTIIITDMLSKTWWKQKLGTAESIASLLLSKFIQFINFGCLIFLKLDSTLEILFMIHNNSIRIEGVQIHT